MFNPLEAKGNQIGVGVYTTPGPGQWEGNAGDWHCQITANRSALDKLHKVWIPRGYWWNITALYRFLEDNYSFNPNLAMRISKIAKYKKEKVTQLLIPTDLLSKKDPDLRATYKAKYKELPTTQKVDYSFWTNRHGVPQPGFLNWLCLSSSIA
ncbi:hypothetical protein EDB81DRAFT_932308 [Dactylonectria macrodidyma]|uniref:Uncharacterized protein n=1 Tax=Dactylonectria macrodidyma TaxID=307937 RepID=A0A9P9F753_9HYPO|nr:hypothetical protein EDB81DRAFT_932308 [Dactylonectria macrodidyma]